MKGLQQGVKQPVISMRDRRLFVKLFFTALMVAVSATMILPFVWMISTSLKPATDVFIYPVEWIPRRFDLSNIKNLWVGKDPLTNYYINSIKATILPVIVSTITCSLAAYGFSKLQFKWREVIFLLYTSMMMVPPQILFVPKFLMFDFMGIYNTLWALILPHFFSVLGVFLMRQFFFSIPNELSEAALVDGANHLVIWWRIVMPLAKPILASYMVLTFTWNWNDYENPLIFISSQKLYTLPLALSKFVLEDNIDYNGMMAAASAGIIPIIIVFLFMQKYVVESVASSGVKG